MAIAVACLSLLFVTSARAEPGASTSIASPESPPDAKVDRADFDAKLDRISRFYRNFQAQAKLDGLTTGRCYDGVCTAFRVLRSETIGRGKLGSIVKARVQDFTADYNEPRLKESRTTALYFHCSRQLPGFVGMDSSPSMERTPSWGFQQITNIYGAATKYIASVYLRVCSGRQMDFLKEEEVTKLMPVLPETLEVDRRRFKSSSEMFMLLEQAYQKANCKWALGLLHRCQGQLLCDDMDEISVFGLIGTRHLRTLRRDAFFRVPAFQQACKAVCEGRPLTRAAVTERVCGFSRSATLRGVRWSETASGRRSEGREWPKAEASGVGEEKVTDEPQEHDWRAHLALAHAAPRCGARRKSDGSPCEQPALPNGRCRVHGGGYVDALRTAEHDDFSTSGRQLAAETAPLRLRDYGTCFL